MSASTRPSIHSHARIGRVHLKVTDLERAIAFHQDVLGFEIMERADGAAFLSSGGYHHHIALNVWNCQDGSRADERAAGRYHLANLYPGRVELARAYARVLRHGVPVRLLEDHGVSEAIYFADPDGNGIEIYRDRERSERPTYSDGSLAMVSEGIDPAGLLARLQSASVA